MKGKKINVKEMDCVNCEPAMCEFAEPMYGQYLFCELKGEIKVQKIHYHLGDKEVSKDTYDRWWNDQNVIGDGS